MTIDTIIRRINTIFMFGFGFTTAFSFLKQGAVGKLASLGIDHLYYGIALMGVACLMWFYNDLKRRLIIKSLMLLPYTLATLVVYFETGSLQGVWFMLYVQSILVLSEFDEDTLIHHIRGKDHE